MKLKGLSLKELNMLENRLKKDVNDIEENIAAQKNQLKKLKNQIGRVRTRKRQLKYKERLRIDFMNLVIQ
jgi:septal ring factor EnvC (AmiA/AmiB activator)